MPDPLDEVDIAARESALDGNLKQTRRARVDWLVEGVAQAGNNRVTGAEVGDDPGCGNRQVQGAVILGE